MGWTVFEYLGVFAMGLTVIGLVAAVQVVVRFYRRRNR